MSLATNPDRRFAVVSLPAAIKSVGFTNRITTISSRPGPASTHKSHTASVASLTVYDFLSPLQLVPRLIYILASLALLT